MRKMSLDYYNADNSINALEHIIHGISDYHKKRVKKLEHDILKTSTDFDIPSTKREARVAQLEKSLKTIEHDYQKQQKTIQQIRSQLFELKDAGRQTLDYTSRKDVNSLLRRIGDEKAKKIFSKEVDQQLARVTKVSHELYKTLQSRQTRNIKTNTFVDGRVDGEIQLHTNELVGQKLQKSIDI